MTTTPNFDDLSPPDELVARWLQNVERNGPASDRYRFGSVAKQAARWGARHGWKQARPLWPEPITDRPPTEADADDRCHVQVLHHCGTWGWDGWNSVAAKSRPWLHTPHWQPRQPSPVTPAEGLAALAEIRGKYPGYECKFLDTIQSALEQAGEGQS